MNTQLHAITILFGDTQVFDDITQFLGVLHVLGCELRNALGVNGLELQGNTKCNRGQNNQLVGGVYAFHIKGGIRFGIAQRLRFSQHIGKLPALVAHLGQDEIAGAINNAGQPFDTVASKALTQRLDDGDAPRYRRFETHLYAMFIGEGKDLVSELGDKRLVGSDHMLAIANGGFHQLPGHRGAADKLHQNIHCRIPGHVKYITADAGIAELTAVIIMAHTYANNLQRRLRAGGYDLSVVLQHTEGAAAHCAEAANADSDRFRAHRFRLLVIFNSGLFFRQNRRF